MAGIGCSFSDSLNKNIAGKGMVRAGRKAPVEFGTIMMVDPSQGSGLISNGRGERIRFFFKDRCRAVPGPSNMGRPLFERVDRPEMPRPGMDVAFVAGHRPNDQPEAFRWCPLESWQACAESSGRPMRSDTPAATIVPFPQGASGDPVGELGRAMDDARTHGRDSRTG